MYWIIAKKQGEVKFLLSNVGLWDKLYWVDRIQKLVNDGFFDDTDYTVEAVTLSVCYA